MTHPLLLSLFDESERRPLSVTELTMQVRVRGRLSVYEPRGEYELIVEALDPVGAGALRVAFEQMRDRLAAEGLFDEALKRPLPVLPRRVAVVTSPACAAGREREEGVDAIIVGRGGGSAEDLWAFNGEEVARAIRASAIPVISAVGHETDFTISDFAADVRAATPTAAAELVAEREDEIASYVERLTHGLVNAARYRVLSERARVQEAAMSPGFDEVRMRLRVAREELDDARCRLENRAGDLSRAARRRLEAVRGKLSPAGVAASASRARVRLEVGGAALEGAARARLDDARRRLGLA